MMSKTRRILFLLLLSALTTNVFAQQLPYQNPSLSIEERARDLCSRLTLEEKARIMRNGSVAIPRLGIPQFEWWNEGLHGVGRNGYATVFPITTGMAASWNDQLLERVFTAVSDEARAKNNLARKAGTIARYQGLSFWTPNINIFRDPRWGRGQETYGEDPYLTTKMGLAVVRGLQGTPQNGYYKLLACAKHFAVHSGPEWNRHSFNIENLPERDLWETYLPAFKSLVQEGDVREVMCAYQRIDGQPCCGNNRYLQQILRDEWKFNGLVVSDCGAIGDFWIKGRHEVDPDAASASAHAVITGTDVECGANYNQLPEAVKAGLISEETINTSVIRLLKERFLVGDFDSEELVPWKNIGPEVVASKDHKQLALDMAHETITLLMNKNNILPLQKGGSQRIAVMGPNATDSIMLWGNYNGYPTSTVTIWKGIKSKCPNATYIPGCGLTRNEVFESRWNEITTPAGGQGMHATYWNNQEMKGEPVTKVDMREPINLSNGGATVFAPGVELENFSARYEGIFSPTRTETLILSLVSDDKGRVIINGDTIINNWKGREKANDTKKELKVEAGKKYNVVVEYVQNLHMAVLQFDIAKKLSPTPQELVAKAKDADVVIFVGGISPRLEGEEMKVDAKGFKGGDRTDIELPESQREVVSLLHQAGKRVVFVNCSGGCMALEPEAQNAEAIVQAWYGGEQGGQALANVLFGDYNPCGKLPITFYKNSSQLPDFLDYRMQGRTYRFFEGEPLFPFGHGLSYTQFTYGKPKYKKGTLTFDLTNSGKREGTEVVQVYLRKMGDNGGPLKTLRAYQRVTLKAGETKQVKIQLDDNAFEWWDGSTNTMRTMHGKFQLMVGGSSDNSALQTLNIKN